MWLGACAVFRQCWACAAQCALLSGAFGVRSGPMQQHVERKCCWSCVEPFAPFVATTTSSKQSEQQPAGRREGASRRQAIGQFRTARTTGDAAQRSLVALQSALLHPDLAPVPFLLHQARPWCLVLNAPEIEERRRSAPGELAASAHVFGYSRPFNPVANLSAASAVAQQLLPRPSPPRACRPPTTAVTSQTDNMHRQNTACACALLLGLLCGEAACAAPCC